MPKRIPPRRTSRSRWRKTTTTTRTKPRNSRRHRPLALLFIFALVLSVTACTSPPPRVAPSGDIGEPLPLARDASAILLQFAAYDYALAGTFSGAQERVVSADRYATVARSALRRITAFTTAAVAASAASTGSTRDRVVSLADALTELARSAASYSDAGDPAAFARVVVDVEAGWRRLRALAEVLPRDAAVDAAIARGTSFVVTSRAERVYGVTAGPFSTAAEATDAARRLGADARGVTTAPPFVVRVGTYGDRAAADAAAATVTQRGMTPIVTDEQRHVFARTGPAPDVELWREPARAFDTAALARRVAIAPGGTWIATGSDDGTVAVFGADGTLRALPRYNAGIAHLAFSDDGRALISGGQTLVVIAVPSGPALGTPIRLTSPATQVIFVPGRAFVASSRGSIAARWPDGNTLGPFPISTPASGAFVAAAGNGEMYIASVSREGATDIEVLSVGVSANIRTVGRAPGAPLAIAVDRGGAFGAVMTEQGVFRFSPRDPDPAKTVVQVAERAREIGVGDDGTLYVLEANRLSARDRGGASLWASPLVDGRRLAVGARVIVLDGTERLIAISADGTVDELGAGGTVQDVALSNDGKRVAAIIDGRRAVLFTLP